MIKDPQKRRSSVEEASVMIDFMARHQQLRETRFLGAAHWARNEVYHITSHQNLSSFWGKYAQLKGAELPSLRSVYLTDLFLDSSNLRGPLGRFKDITTLGLIVNMEQGLAKDVCQSIFEACPMLVRLHLRFQHGLSYYAEIAEMSRRAIHLRHLTLAGQFNLLIVSATIASQFSRGLAVIQRNPYLDSFALYFGGQFTLSEISAVASEAYAYGEFTVLRDTPCGKPKKLLVKEVRRGIGVNFAHRYVKEITEDLLPSTDLAYTPLSTYEEASPWLGQRFQSQ